MINSPGVNEFIDLKDAPNSYTGQASKVVKVNVGETAVEFGAGGGGAGTVTDVSVVTANGVSGSVATSTTTPAITLTLGAITPSSVGSVGAVTGSNLSGTNTGDNATNTQYSGLVSNATHTGDATGATALTVVQIQGKAIPAPVAGDDQKVIKYNHGTLAFIYDTVSGGSGLSFAQVYSLATLSI